MSRKKDGNLTSLWREVPAPEGGRQALEAFWRRSQRESEVGGAFDPEKVVKMVVASTPLVEGVWQVDRASTCICGQKCCATASGAIFGVKGIAHFELPFPLVPGVCCGGPACL